MVRARAAGCRPNTSSSPGRRSGTSPVISYASAWCLPAAAADRGSAPTSRRPAAAQVYVVHRDDGTTGTLHQRPTRRLCLGWHSACPTGIPIRSVHDAGIRPRPLQLRSVKPEHGHAAGAPVQRHQRHRNRRRRAWMRRAGNWLALPDAQDFHRQAMSNSRESG